MTPDQIAAATLTTMTAAWFAAYTLDHFATWNRARRTNRKATR